MTRPLLILSLGLWLGGTLRAQGRSAVEVARRFLVPNTQLEELYTFDYSAGRVSSRCPAVLTGHILSADSDDVVFAYYSPHISVLEKTLFITLLHRTSSGYEKEYELAYRSHVLLVPSAMRILRLGGQTRDVAAVMHGIGAALGGQIDVFRWEEPAGWRNIFPANGSVHYFTILQDHGRVRVRLGYGKSIDAATPPPVEYVWNGKEFAKAR